MAEKDQEFVEHVVKAIVEMPEKVQIERKIDERGVLLELTVDPADMGKIIGKDGRTAKAIRTLLRVLGAQNDARVNLKIIEPEGGTGPRVRDEAPVETEGSPSEVSRETDEVSQEAPVEADMPETTTSADLQDLSE
jgi:hypothetical protein